MSLTSIEQTAAALDAYGNSGWTAPAPAPTTSDSWRADVISASSIRPRPITWLWPTWLATGKLTILAGAAGTGKTTLCLGLIATLSCAGRWPDGERCTAPGNTIIWSSEDDPADTLIPRLMAMGADLRRVFFIQGRIDDKGNKEPFDPANDMDLLRETAQRIGGVSLLMLDPIVSSIRGDMHKANDVRRGLQPVIDFAVEQDAAIVGISHFAKGSQGSSPQERVIGSQAFSALARMVLVAAKQEDSDMRVLARAKSNIAIDDGGVSYGIEEATVDGGIETTRVYWGEKIEGSAREILGSVEDEGGDSSEREDAEQFLRDLLADGPVPSKQVKADADGAGFAWATIRRAQKIVGIEAYKDGDGIGKKSAWFWRLPCKAGFTKMLTETPKMLSPGSEHLRENVSTLVAEEGTVEGTI